MAADRCVDMMVVFTIASHHHTLAIDFRTKKQGIDKDCEAIAINVFILPCPGRFPVLVNFRIVFLVIEIFQAPVQYIISELLNVRVVQVL